MSQGRMRDVLLCLAVALAMLSYPARAQEKSDVPIKVTPVAAAIAAPGDGGQPPTFVVETEPGLNIDLMFGTSIKSFTGSDSLSIKKFYSTYMGNEEAGIEPIALKTNESGKLVFTLLDEVFEALAGEGGRIYYIAAAIEPRDAGSYDILGQSFDRIYGDPAEAPYVTVEESSTLRQAKEHWQAGQAFYLEGDFLAAIGEFEAALELKPAPAFKYNIGVCYLRLAKTFLSDYLNSGKASKREEKELREFLTRAENFISSFNRHP